MNQKVLLHLTNQNLFVIFDSLRRIKMNQNQKWNDSLKWIKNQKKIPIHLANRNLFVIFDSLRRFKMYRFGPSPFSDISVYGKNQTYHDSWIIFFPITFSVFKNLSRLFRLKYRQKVTARIFDCKKYGKNPWRHKLFELSKVWVIQLKLSQPSAPVSALDINELNVDLKISPTLLGPLYWHIKYIKPFLPKTQIKSFVNTWEIFEIIRGAIFNKFWTKTRTQMFLSIFFAKFWRKKIIVVNNAAVKDAM